MGEIRAEHDGKAMAASAMADQPSVERWRQSNTGQRVGRDVGDKRVDLVKASPGSVEAPTGDFDNVINQRGEVLVDQRMSNDAHQAAVPPPDLASLARWARAPDVMDASVRTGSHASRGRARRLWTSASKSSRSRTDNLPQPAVLVADRGHDSDRIREDIERRNALPMSPMRKNRKVRKVVDMAIYTLRNMVELCLNKLKNSRRLATRYDKTADSFLGFVDVACIRLWLRHLST